MQHALLWGPARTARSALAHVDGSACEQQEDTRASGATKARQQAQHADEHAGRTPLYRATAPGSVDCRQMKPPSHPCAASLTRHDLVGVSDGGVELQDGVHSGTKLDANGRQRVAACDLQQGAARQCSRDACQTPPDSPPLAGCGAERLWVREGGPTSGPRNKAPRQKQIRSHTTSFAPQPTV